MNYDKLLEPGKIGTMELKNRMVMPGMGTNLAAADGTVSDVIVNYYARRANGYGPDYHGGMLSRSLRARDSRRN